MRALTVLSGGVGGATFLRGLLHAVRRGELRGVDADAEVTVIANTADDIWLYGLQICPDLDTVMYTLGDGIDDERGGAGATRPGAPRRSSRRTASEPTWFGLGDRDLATHLVRTQMLDAGVPAVRGDRGPLPALAARRPAAADDRRPRRDPHRHRRPDSPSGRRVVHFQEYWVRLHAEVPAEAVLAVGQDESSPGPGVLDAITDADLVLVPPSNPVVSVGTILGVPGVARGPAWRPARRWSGCRPIIGGTHVRGMADQMLTAIGVEVSAAGVGLHYGARSAGGVLDGWLVDTVDEDEVARRPRGRARLCGRPAADDLAEATAAMAAAALDLVAVSVGVITVWAPDGVAEVAAGDDLADLLAAPSPTSPTATSSCVTSKVVSKAEGRVVSGRPRWRPSPPRPVAWSRDAGPGDRASTGSGLVMAAAGVDASNVAARQRRPAARGPRRLGARPARRPCATRAGANVGVVVTDTVGRTWREGQTDLAVGAAGLLVLDDHAGPRRRLRQRAGRDRAGRRRRAGRRGRARRRQARPQALHRGPRPGRPGARPGRPRAGRRRAAPPGGLGPVRARRPRGRPRRARCHGTADRTAFGTAAEPDELVAILTELDRVRW